MGMFVYGGILVCGVGFACFVISQITDAVEEQDRRRREEWERRNHRSIFR